MKHSPLDATISAVNAETLVLGVETSALGHTEIGMVGTEL